jgi:hypothetical protein
MGNVNLSQKRDQSTYGTGNLIPKKSMEYSLVNCLFSVQLLLS